MFARDAVVGGVFALKTSAVASAAFKITKWVLTYIILPNCTLLHTSSSQWFKVIETRTTLSTHFIVPYIALIIAAHAA